MPKTQAWIEERFGKFDWSPNPNRRGSVTIEGHWIIHNLARIDPPFPLTDGYGHRIRVITCHALIADALTAVLVELKDSALTHLINTFDGCWVPRHMCWDTSRSLSHHSWGIAVDVNARLFPYGSPHRQDPRLIAAFRRAGFEWGGNWHTPDPMHFEMVTLDVVGDQTGVKIVVDDQLVSQAGRLIDGQAEGPLAPVVDALGATLTIHPEQRKIYVYTNRDPRPQ